MKISDAAQSLDKPMSVQESVLNLCRARTRPPWSNVLPRYPTLSQSWPPKKMEQLFLGNVSVVTESFPNK